MSDKGVRALWDEKNKFMEALEIEMAEKNALIAERERLRNEIDAACIRIVAAEVRVRELEEVIRTGGLLRNDLLAERDMIRDAWNAHMERCPDRSTFHKGPTMEEIEAWKNAPSDTASADVAPLRDQERYS